MKKIKIIKIIGVFIIFALCFSLHFLYDKFPNFITSIFVPVNESIWEHMKLIFTSYLIYTVIENIIFKKKNIETNNYLLQTFIVPIIGIIFYLIIFIPLYNIFGENMFISLSLLFLIIILEQFISYKLLTYSNNINYGNIISIIGIILTYIIFTFLTYYPPKTSIFYDTETGEYGITK